MAGLVCFQAARVCNTGFRPDEQKPRAYFAVCPEGKC